MKAIILAAGRGIRMMPLTKDTPKPLLKVANITLIEGVIKQLKAANIYDIVINTAYLGAKIEEFLGDGSDFGITIKYSREGTSPLETAGGIINAMPLIGDAPFIAINADIICDYDLNNLTKLDDNALAKIVLTNNPKHNIDGDFAVDNNIVINNDANKKLTFSGIGLYHHKLFNTRETTKLPLINIFDELIKTKQLSATIHNGFWCDVGTPDRLLQLNNTLKPT